jgi:hypothetical protein
MDPSLFDGEIRGFDKFNQAACMIVVGVGANKVMDGWISTLTGSLRQECFDLRGGRLPTSVN